MKKVLIATDIPFWLREKGNQQRIFELVDYLASVFETEVFYFGLTPPELDLPCRLHAASPPLIARLVQAVRQCLPYGFGLRCIAALNRLGYTRDMAQAGNPCAARRFAHVMDQGAYDVVIVEYVRNTFLLDGLDKAKPVTILDTHDIFSLRTECYKMYGRVPDRSISREDEYRLMGRYHWIMAIQEAEATLLGRHFEGRVLLCMHPHRPDGGRESAVRTGGDGADKLRLVFFSSYGDLNVDALQWFVGNVWDESLRQRYILDVYGTICRGISLKVPGVRLRGPVRTVDEAYAEADVVINPLRFGSGLKVKSVEAVAWGLPLVTTSVGAEGLVEGAGTFLFLADTAGDMRAVLKRLTDPELRRSACRAARIFADRRLTPEACFRDLRRVIKGDPDPVRTGDD